ncbi:glutamate--cysteine ligase [Paradevosia shaoguanensis]|uniref:Glutamate--cysteine ligase n=1 Tax=Paradevosia shaoguanensis TaxID=1335043 RepID=A0AA41QKZ3_9HYPH|nr:glutamate--cysteine ligase [Paradevosia shaoguanensis]MCF1741624.1 glutamate--cysteine ligase [Paradevosia shaoguanensis]MCI0126107.1 glutamate--cysteine ligase [Paradevosia shaoguanensis]
MAGASSPSPLIESRADLIEALERGCKPKDQWRVGTEHEKHVFHRNPLRPVTYDGADGVHALLDGVEAETGWHPFFDGENPIGLRNLGPSGGISLEPGGQFELSGAPMVSLHDTALETAEHMAVSRKIGSRLGIHFLGLGVTPLWSVAEIPAMPKSRYGIMKPYMEKVGTLGTSMMFRSATIQANLDFSSEADMVRKLRVSVALQPVATALFANSPFIDGKDSGFLSFRSHIWLNTDAARTGMLPFAFEEGMSFERYVDYALDVPMYFVIRNGQYVNVAGESFRAFLEGRLPQLPGEKPTVKDWEDHLSTLFPEVRLKQFLEMRGADMGDEAAITALPAFWVGLLYDDIALEEAWELVKDWTEFDRQAMRNEVPRLGLQTPVPGNDLRFGTVGDLAREVVGIASAGLARRAQVNALGKDETIYLAPLEETLRLGKTPAERWLDLYRTEWNGDVRPIFDAAEM